MLISQLLLLRILVLQLLFRRMSPRMATRQGLTPAGPGVPAATEIGDIFLINYDLYSTSFLPETSYSSGGRSLENNSLSFIIYIKVIAKSFLLFL
jgi:hypothetical protein